MNKIKYIESCRHSVVDNAIISIESLAEAYNIQHQVMQSIDVGAWKLGGSTSHTQNIFNTKNVYYGPIESSSIFSSDGHIKLPIKIEKPVGEVEVCFVLSAMVHSLEQSQIEQGNVLQYVECARIGMELPWSNFNLPEAGLNTLVGDCCASGALILGSLVDTVDVSTGQIIVASERNILTEGNVSNILGGPLHALKEFLLLAVQHKLLLKPGQVIATGGATPCIPLPIGKQITVTLEDEQVLTFKLGA